MRLHLGSVHARVSGFALTILAVLCTAWLNRADARNRKADLKADTAELRIDLKADIAGLSAKLDTTNMEIVMVRERLARLEERTGIRAAS